MVISSVGCTQPSLSRCGVGVGEKAAADTGGERDSSAGIHGEFQQ